MKRTSMIGKMKIMLMATVAICFSQESLGAITNLQASSDSTNANYSYSFAGAPNILQVYLDTDRSAGSGYSVQGIGANFMIENGNLYRYSGSGGSSWGWTSVGSSNMVRSTSSVRFTVTRASLGSPAALNLVARTSAGETSAVMSQTFSSTTTPTTTTLPPTTTSWVRCAAEGGTCSFSGTRQVRYGANGTFAYRTATGSIACNNATFGDPVVGVVKACDHANSTSPNPTTTTVPPTNPPVTTTTLAPPSTTLPPSGSVRQVSYSVSNSIFPNPERGFYQQPDCGSQVLSVSQLQGYRSTYGHTMLRCMYYLRNYKSGPLPQSVLDFFQRNMDTIRAAGFKIVLRFAYTSNEAGDDAPHSVVLGHVNQLASYLQRNIDVIASMEAGFVGAWGEWSQSQNYGSFNNWTAQNWADRKALVDRLLMILPSDRTVGLRTPNFKVRMFGSAALTDAEAFTGTPKSRLGHYNDCFVSTSSDAGTYGNTSVEYPYLAQESKYLIMGGETCAVGFPSSRSDCSTALQEMAMFHWSYINEGFHMGVLDKWRTQGCYTTIQARLGYRFVLLNGTFSSTSRVGGSINVTINLRNDGFASPYNRRGIQLILRNDSTGAVHRLPLNGDPRRWLPNQAIAINQTVALPANLTAGNYSLLLSLPDTSPSIANRPEYSIQLANSNVWEAATGFNRLNSTLTVSP